MLAAAILVTEFLRDDFPLPQCGRREVFNLTAEATSGRHPRRWLTGCAETWFEENDPEGVAFEYDVSQ
jgi:hypothetical protein